MFILNWVFESKRCIFSYSFRSLKNTTKQFFFFFFRYFLLTVSCGILLMGECALLLWGTSKDILLDISIILESLTMLQLDTKYINKLQSWQSYWNKWNLYSIHLLLYLSLILLITPQDKVTNCTSLVFEFWILIGAIIMTIKVQKNITY